MAKIIESDQLVCMDVRVEYDRSLQPSKMPPPNPTDEVLLYNGFDITEPVFVTDLVVDSGRMVKYIYWQLR